MPKLAGGTRLVGEAETIGPALLFGAPAAVPVESDAPRGVVRRVDRRSAAEELAAGPCIDLDPLDRQLRVVFQDLHQHALDLDGRAPPIEFDAIVRLPVTHELGNSGPEWFRGAGLLQKIEKAHIFS